MLVALSKWNFRLVGVSNPGGNRQGESPLNMPESLSGSARTTANPRATPSRRSCPTDDLESILNPNLVGQDEGRLPTPTRVRKDPVLYFV